MVNIVVHSRCCELSCSSADNLPAIQQTLVGFPGQEDELEKGEATHSSVLAWRIHMDRGAWSVTVYEVTKSQTRLSDSNFPFHIGCVPQGDVLEVILYLCPNA